jgi:hypothetical protein
MRPKKIHKKVLMYKIYDFRCKCGNVFERMVGKGVSVIRCDCGSYATKMLSAPKCVLDGHSGDFPGRHMKWIREHERAGRKEKSP